MKNKYLFLIAAILLFMPLGLNNKVEAATVSTINYTVKSGDTLQSVANSYQIGADEIQNVNIGSLSTLKAGTVIKIPDLSEIKSFQEEVVRLSNIERTKIGVQPVTSDWKISRVARYKANDMRDNLYFSHNSPTYGDPFYMLNSFGIYFSNAAENIAGKQQTPADVVKSWMNSDSHRTTLLNPNYTKLGVGYSEGGPLGTYWVQMFTRP